MVIDDTWCKETHPLCFQAVEPALRTLAHLFYHNPDMDFSLSNAISIARHFILYGLSIRYTKPDKLTPIEHANVIEPVKIIPKAGKVNIFLRN